jgi:ribonuclease P protein subunit RPR2
LKPNRADVKKIAKERMDILLNRAMQGVQEKSETAQRYVGIARKIGMRYKVRIPSRWRLLICKGCHKLILPGINSRVRLQRFRDSHLAITCLECGKVKRIPLKNTRRYSRPQKSREMVNIKKVFT